MKQGSFKFKFMKQILLIKTYISEGLFVASSWIGWKALFRSETQGAAKNTEAFTSCPHIYTDNWEHRSVQLAKAASSRCSDRPQEQTGIGTDARRLRIIHSMTEPWAQTNVTATHQSRDAQPYIFTDHSSHEEACETR